MADAWTPSANAPTGHGDAGDDDLRKLAATLREVAAPLPVQLKSGIWEWNGRRYSGYPEAARERYSLEERLEMYGVEEWQGKPAPTRPSGKSAMPDDLPVWLKLIILVGAIPIVVSVIAFIVPLIIVVAPVVAVLVALIFIVGAVGSLFEEEEKSYGTSTRREPIDPKLRWTVFQSDGYSCNKCGATHDLTVDHIYPVSRGGGNELDNLQTLCRSCNSRKGDLV